MAAFWKMELACHDNLVLRELRMGSLDMGLEVGEGTSAGKWFVRGNIGFNGTSTHPYQC